MIQSYSIDSLNIFFYIESTQYIRVLFVF